jgi:hypothetical protein
MNKIEIEFKQSPTGMYSPWHLDVAHEYNVPLICTSDIGHFVKIGNDIYKIRSHAIDLYDKLIQLEDKNDSGEISDEDTLKKIDLLISEYKLRKCTPLDEFRKLMIKQSKQNKKHK